MKFRIIKNIVVFGKNQNGFKELSVIRWFDNGPPFDIRIWSADHEPFKGGLIQS